MRDFQHAWPLGVISDPFYLKLQPNQISKLNDRECECDENIANYELSAMCYQLTNPLFSFFQIPIC
mgnify:CR=1 FL=1